VAQRVTAGKLRLENGAASRLTTSSQYGR